MGHTWFYWRVDDFNRFDKILLGAEKGLVTN